MQTYTSSKLTKIIGLSIGAVFIGIFSYMLGFLVNPRMIQHPNFPGDLIAAVFIVILLLFFSYMALEIGNTKLEIGEDRISLSGVLTTRELQFEEIKGFRIDRDYIYIEPNTKEKKRLKVTMKISRSGELLEWLKNNYKDLDLFEKEQEYQSILNREEYGKTIEERKHKLGKANELAITLNILGVVIAILLIPAKIEKFMVLLAMATPVIFIIILRLSKGLVRLDLSKSSPYPSIFIAFAAVIFALMMKSVRYNILDPNDVWQPAIILGVVMVAFLMIGNKEFHRINAARIAGIVLITISAFVYGYGSVVLVNCMFDRSQGQHFQAAIFSKRMSTGKKRGYHLILSPWGNQHEVRDILVSYEWYNRLNIDDSVDIYQYAGRMNISWYSVPDFSKISDK